MTIGAITAIRQSEKHIPAEIPVIGFDDTPWVPLVDPPLTVVHQPAYEMGANSAELLQNRLYPQPNLDGAQHIVLPTTLVHRISCYSRGFYL
jgi:LacI family transcriptional regulator